MRGGAATTPGCREGATARRGGLAARSKPTTLGRTADKRRRRRGAGEESTDDGWCRGRGGPTARIQGRRCQATQMEEAHEPAPAPRSRRGCTSPEEPAARAAPWPSLPHDEAPCRAPPGHFPRRGRHGHATQGATRTRATMDEPPRPHYQGGAPRAVEARDCLAKARQPRPRRAMRGRARAQPRQGQVSPQEGGASRRATTARVVAATVGWEATGGCCGFRETLT
jgi:hypothetical protein